MKKIFVTAAALVAFGTAANAQTVSVSAKVASVVTASTPSTLDFGSAVAPGASSTVLRSVGSTFNVVYNVPTNVALPNSVSLTGSGGGTLSVTLNCGQAGSTGAAEASIAAFSTGSCSGGHDAALVGGVSTTRYFYIGGSLTVPASAPAGTYTGSASVTLTYTSF